jgi:hypothetical protein
MKAQIRTMAFGAALMAAVVASPYCEASGVRPDHIVVVFEENHGFSEIIGNSRAPFINKLASEGLLFTRFYGIGRPSQLNYFVLFSGSTQGVRDNGKHTISAPSLADQLEKAGLSFIGYGETGAERKHKPWESFVGPQHRTQDFDAFPANFDNLPTVAFVTPNLSHNMHDGTIEEGDQWSRKHFERYVEWAKDHNSVFILTFDEDGGYDRNRVATIVVGAGIDPGRIDKPRNHYSLLRTIQSIYGLGPLGRRKVAPLFSVRRIDSNQFKVVLER